MLTVIIYIQFILCEHNVVSYTILYYTTGILYKIVPILLHCSSVGRSVIIRDVHKKTRGKNLSAWLDTTLFF